MKTVVKVLLQNCEFSDIFEFFFVSDDDTDTATEGEEEIRARELRKQEVCVEPPVTDTGTDTEVKPLYDLHTDSNGDDSVDPYRVPRCSPYLEIPDLLKNNGSSLLQLSKSSDDISLNSNEFNSAESDFDDAQQNNLLKSNATNNTPSNLINKSLNVFNPCMNMLSKSATTSSLDAVAARNNYILPSKDRRKSFGKEFVPVAQLAEPLLIIKRTPNKINLPVEVGKPKVSVNANLNDAKKYFGENIVKKPPIPKPPTTKFQPLHSPILIKQQSLPEQQSFHLQNKSNNYNFEPGQLDLEDADNYIENLLKNKDDLLKAIDLDKYKGPNKEDEESALGSIDDLLKALETETSVDDTDLIEVKPEEKIEDLLKWMDELDHQVKETDVYNTLSTTKYRNLERHLKTPERADSVISKLPKSHISVFEKQPVGKSVNIDFDDNEGRTAKVFQLKKSKTDVHCNKQRHSIDLDAIKKVDVKKVLQKFEGKSDDMLVHKYGITSNKSDSFANCTQRSFEKNNKHRFTGGSRDFKLKTQMFERKSSCGNEVPVIPKNVTSSIYYTEDDKLVKKPSHKSSDPTYSENLAKQEFYSISKPKGHLQNIELSTTTKSNDSKNGNDHSRLLFNANLFQNTIFEVNKEYPTTNIPSSTEFNSSNSIINCNVEDDVTKTGITYKPIQNVVHKNTDLKLCLKSTENENKCTLSVSNEVLQHIDANNPIINIAEKENDCLRNFQSISADKICYPVVNIENGHENSNNKINNVSSELNVTAKCDQNGEEASGDSKKYKELEFHILKENVKDLEEEVDTDTIKTEVISFITDIVPKVHDDDITNKEKPLNDYKNEEYQEYAVRNVDVGINKEQLSNSSAVADISQNLSQKENFFVGNVTVKTTVYNLLDIGNVEDGSINLPTNANNLEEALEKYPVINKTQVNQKQSNSHNLNKIENHGRTLINNSRDNKQSAIEETVNIVNNEQDFKKIDACERFDIPVRPPRCKQHQFGNLNRCDNSFGAKFRSASASPIFDRKSVDISKIPVPSERKKSIVKSGAIKKEIVNPKAFGFNETSLVPHMFGKNDCSSIGKGFLSGSADNISHFSLKDDAGKHKIAVVKNRGSTCSINVHNVYPISYKNFEKSNNIKKELQSGSVGNISLISQQPMNMKKRELIEPNICDASLTSSRSNEQSNMGGRKKLQVGSADNITQFSHETFKREHKIKDGKNRYLSGREITNRPLGNSKQLEQNITELRGVSNKNITSFLSEDVQGLFENGKQNENQRDLRGGSTENITLFPKKDIKRIYKTFDKRKKDSTGGKEKDCSIQ